MPHCATVHCVPPVSFSPSLPPSFAVCALVATRTDSELQELLGGEALASIDLSFFSSATAPQLVGGLLAQVGG